MISWTESCPAEWRTTEEDAEVRIWSELRRRAIGVHFRRQHPIGPYILDFTCLTLKLAIELHGCQHYDAIAADANRDQYLRRKGWTVLRFSSHDALTNTDLVVEEILKAIKGDSARAGFASPPIQLLTSPNHLPGRCAPVEEIG